MGGQVSLWCVDFSVFAHTPDAQRWDCWPLSSSGLTVFPNGSTTVCSRQQCEFSLPASSASFPNFYPAGYSHSNWGEAGSLGGLCLDDWRCWTLFLCSLATCVSYFEKRLFRSLARLRIQLDCFGALCALRIKHLLDGFSPIPQAVSLLCCFRCCPGSSFNWRCILRIIHCFLLPALRGHI